MSYVYISTSKINTIMWYQPVKCYMIMWYQPIKCDTIIWYQPMNYVNYVISTNKIYKLCDINQLNV